MTNSYFSLADRIAAIYNQSGPGDECRGRRAQEKNGANDIVSSSPPPQRRSVENLAGTLRIRLKRLCETGSDPSGRNRIHADSLASPSDSQRFRQLHDTSFSGAIRRRIAATEKREHRSYVNDATTLPCQQRTGADCDPHRTGEVHFEITGEHLGTKLFRP